MRPQWTTKLLAFSLISLLAYGAYLGLAPDSPVQPDPANQAHRTKNDAFSSGPEHSSAIAEREARENVETYSGSLEQKGLETKKQAMAHFGLTEEEINSQSAALATVIVDKSASDLFRNELKNALIEQYGSDEGSFLFYTTSITEWSELKAAVRERSELTGLAYDDLLLRQGIMMGEITADELLSLTASAGAVPEDIALQLAATANFEALIELTKNGY